MICKINGSFISIKYLEHSTTRFPQWFHFFQWQNVCVKTTRHLLFKMDSGKWELELCKEVNLSKIFYQNGGFIIQFKFHTIMTTTHVMDSDRPSILLFKFYKCFDWDIKIRMNLFKFIRHLYISLINVLQGFLFCLMIFVVAPHPLHSMKHGNCTPNTHAS